MSFGVIFPLIPLRRGNEIFTSNLTTPNYRVAGLLTHKLFKLSV